MSLDTSKLINVKRFPDGSYQCQCPQCFREGRDLKGKNHLRIYSSGAFNCCVDNSKEHNKAIRALLRGYLPSGEQAEVVYMEPKLEVETVYPESVLQKLLPQYDYWLGRGMKEDVLKRLENGLAPHGNGPLEGRSVFPVRNLDNQIIGFAGRLVAPSWKSKWKNAVKTSKCVWPWNVTGKDIIESKTCILTESPGDMLACLSYGIKPVLCIFGLNLNSLIISTLLAHNVKTVIISLNRDDDPRKGQAAADKIAAKLANFFTDVRIVLPPIGRNDWGECAKKGDDAAFNVLREALI